MYSVCHKWLRSLLGRWAMRPVGVDTARTEMSGSMLDPILDSDLVLFGSGSDSDTQPDLDPIICKIFVIIYIRVEGENFEKS